MGRFNERRLQKEKAARRGSGLPSLFSLLCVLKGVFILGTKTSAKINFADTI
jgi:hypothetical protein